MGFLDWLAARARTTPGNEVSHMFEIEIVEDEMTLLNHPTL
ncbi:hypothetical protein [Streptoalloteichus tenebrarius]|nr:hypothetical protein [Streptoalloteichus tenebrarius]